MISRCSKYFILGLIILTIGCQQKKEVTSYTGPLFHLRPKQETNIDFANVLPESKYMNRFVYEYFYNGGGVAIGDVNNDGLDDIYFTSNLKDNKLYLNKGEFVFEDITNLAGIKGKKGWATGVSMVDINQDGLMDIYVCRAGRFTDHDKRRNELFINQGINANGVPVFKEGAKAYGLDDPSFTTKATFFDYDKDGDLDAFLANYNIEPPPAEDISLIMELRNEKSSLGGNRLLRNDNGKFINVTATSGIHTHMLNYTLDVSIGDVNLDGWPDIYVANDFSEPDHLYINSTNGTFKDQLTNSTGHISTFTMGSDIADINNDGWPDIMSVDMAASDNYTIKTSMSSMDADLFWKHVDSGLHYQYMYNSLQLNNGIDRKGQLHFSEIGQLANISNTDWSWATLVADFDNDGLNDIFVANGLKRDYRNNDFNTFLKKAVDKVIREKDNPLKYYQHWTQFSPIRAKSNYFFMNEGNLKFANKSKDWSLDQPSFSNGAAYGDLDNDGDLDIVVNNIDASAFIYENQSNKIENHHFLKIQLEGPDKNRSGIGAKVILTGENLDQIREQFPARGFQSSISPVLHFGLGNITEIEELKIIWPDGKQQRLKNIKVDQKLFLSYKDAVNNNEEEELPLVLFETLDLEKINLNYYHSENAFDDFEREGLLPHKMSQLGPALDIGDINNDGLDDLYLGGAMEQEGQIFVQKTDGSFQKQHSLSFVKDKKYEDIASVFFDAEGDGDLDLYVVSGGNEKEEGNKIYQDRLYENISGNFIKTRGALPLNFVSGGCVIVEDFDNDGDVDLFVGGRQVPGKYPSPASSYILRNDSKIGEIKFTDVSSEIAPMLQNIGMVTDAQWLDIDGDNQKDLIVIGEWMPPTILKNNNGVFEDITESTGLSEQIGWWNTIVSDDFDSDGDIDFVVGNLGLNYKYKASDIEPFEIYASDFDDTGTNDIVLGYYNGGSLYPVRGRQCSSEQMPFIKEKYQNYADFGNATVLDVYGKEKLKNSIHYKATNFASSYIENLGNGTFNIRSLPQFAQMTSVNSVEVIDVNKDGVKDLVLIGNMYNSEVETPRNDAGYGLCMLGDGKGNFKALLPYESGLLVKGEVRNSGLITIGKSEQAILFAKNNDAPQMVVYDNKANTKNNNK